MDKNQRKNIRRRKLTQSHQHAQFITAYTKAMHPEIYRKASQMYDDLKELYPEKRDLRKVPQFLSLTTGTKSLNSYYYKNKMSRKIRQDDKMVLEIPLTKYTGQLTDQTSASTLESATIIPDETNASTLESATIIPDETNPPTGELSSINHDQTNASTLESATIIPDETNPPTGELLSDIIPNHIYNQLLAELTNDPDLSRILNEFQDWEEDNIIVEYPSIDEPTPLEWELHNLDY